MRLGVSVVIFGIIDDDLKVLLVKKDRSYALPGDIVRPGDVLERIVKQTVTETTGIRSAYIEQLYSFNLAKGVQVTYLVIIDSKKLKLLPEMFSVKKLPKLVTGHKQIIKYGLKRLRNKIEYTSVGLRLLPDHFTLSELRNVYELILDEKLDKRNFRKKIISMGVVEPTSRVKSGSHRPAILYKYKEVVPKSKFKRITFEG